MTRRQIDRFFAVLGRELASPARVIVTGAAAGCLWGHVRPSLDIDFAIQSAGGARQWPAVETAIERTTRLTGLAANYAVDIDRWGSIALLDYRRHTHRYRVFGRVTVHVLDPTYWTIGKLSRYLAPDVEDLVAVLKRRRQPVEPLVRVWGRALRRSPRSLACTQFRRQAEDFLTRHGRTIWGKTFDWHDAIARFHRHAHLGPA